MPEATRIALDARPKTSRIERVAKAGAACYGSGEAEVTLS